MPREDHTSPPSPEDPVDSALDDLLAGPSPINMVHGAIDLEGSGEQRPSQAAIEAARNEILAALWGPSP